MVSFKLNFSNFATHYPNVFRRFINKYENLSIRQRTSLEIFQISLKMSLNSSYISHFPEKVGLFSKLKIPALSPYRKCLIFLALLSKCMKIFGFLNSFRFHILSIF